MDCLRCDAIALSLGTHSGVCYRPSLSHPLINPGRILIEFCDQKHSGSTNIIASDRLDLLSIN
ncbi:hypothetical protein NSP_51770 [Nodularia spumigena CCY9414]|nr:hypothetical protein NSP_51770 [Nodularia spumigena CCY9414]